MGLEEINLENADKFVTLVDADMMENIGRVYYRGMALTDDGGKPQATMIWELIHSDDEERDTESRLMQLNADGDQAKKLFAEYKKDTDENEIRQTSFELACEKEREAVFSENGFTTEMREAKQVTVTVSDIAKLPISKKMKTPKYIRDLSELDARVFKRGLLNCLFYGRRETTEDLNALPMDWFDCDVSCYTETDGRIDGLLLVHRTASGRLRIELLINVGPEAKKDLAYMLNFTATRVREKYSDDTEILIPRNDVSAEKLAAYFFPGLKGEKVLFGSRREEG